MLSGVVVLLCLAGTALLVGATIGVSSAAELVLTAYVVAFTEIVGVSLFLSAFDSLTHSSLVAATVMLLAASAATWVLRGAPRPAVLVT